jgi:hypothetical protein
MAIKSSCIKVIAILTSTLLICSCSGNSDANKQNTAAQNKITQKKPLPDRFKVAGTSKQKATNFLYALQKNVKNNDKHAVAKLTQFPLRINKTHNKTIFIKNKTNFIKKYNQIISPIKSLIINQKPNKLFVNSQGIMLGNGELWARPNTRGEIKIIVINQIK